MSNEVSEHIQKTYQHFRDELTRRGISVPEPQYTIDHTIDLSWGEFDTTGPLLLLNISDECVCFYGNNIRKIGEKSTSIHRDANATVESLCAALVDLNLAPESRSES